MNTWTLIVRDNADGIEIIDDPVTRDRTVICSPYADLDEVYNRLMLENMDLARFHLDRSPFVAALANRITTHDGVIAEVHTIATAMRALLYVIIALTIGFVGLSVVIIANHW